MPSVTVVERDYPGLYAQFTSIGPLLEKIGNGGKGIGWNTDHEVEFLRALNGKVAAGPTAGQPRLETDIMPSRPSSAWRRRPTARSRSRRGRRWVG